MKKLTCILIAAILVLTLCACGAQPPEATAPIEPTDQSQHATETTTATTAVPVETVSASDTNIIDSVEPTMRPDIWVHTAYPSRETFSVEVRLQVVTENGTIEYIDLNAQAVEWPNDWAEPLYNLVNGINPIEIQEIWVRSEEFNISHVNCCQSYSNGDDGWSKVNCFQKHLDSRDDTYTYQLVSVDEDGTPVNAIYATLRFFK